MADSFRHASPTIAVSPGPAELPENVFQDFSRWMARIDKEFGDPLVCVTEQQQASGSGAIAAGAADFLVVGFNRIGDIGVNDESDFAAINAHSERICRNDDALAMRS